MDLTLGDPEVKVQLFRFIDAMPALADDRVGPPAPGRIPGRGGRPGPLVAPAGGRAGPAGLARARGSWPGCSRFAAAHMARRFIAGATPDEALATVRGLRRQRARLHGRPARRGRHQRGRGRGLSADLPRPAPRPGRPARGRARDRPDRPRRPRADPARQPLAQADEPDGPVRRPPRRGDDRPRRRAAPADPPRRPASSGRTSTSTWSSTPTRT